MTPEKRTAEGKKIWFPAKKYGWGWGLPCSWEGWVVTVAYVVLATVCVLLADKRVGLGALGVSLLTALLIVICVVKGEKPHWRWGKD